MTQSFTVFHVGADSTDQRHRNLAARPGWYAERDDWTVDMGMVHGPFGTRERAEQHMRDQPDDKSTNFGAVNA